MRKIDWRAFAYTHKRLIAAACAVCLTVAALCAFGGGGVNAASATRAAQSRAAEARPRRAAGRMIPQ